MIYDNMSDKDIQEAIKVLNQELKARKIREYKEYEGRVMCKKARGEVIYSYINKIEVINSVCIVYVSRLLVMSKKTSITNGVEIRFFVDSESTVESIPNYFGSVVSSIVADEVISLIDAERRIKTAPY